MKKGGRHTPESLAKMSATLRARGHGDYGTPEYRTWQCMRARCTYPPTNDYARYGGRGISVCERWSSYQNFLADMGRRPSPKHSIERLDSDGHYEPANCVWATPQEQQRNRCNNCRLTLNGETLPAVAWSERLGISTDVISNRLKLGWSDERTLTEPVAIRRKQNFLTEAQVIEIKERAANGELQVRIAERFGINFQQVSRIVRGQRWRLTALEADVAVLKAKVGP